MHRAAPASDRVATQVGPGDPRDVLSTLLNSSKYDFILLGVPGRPTSVEKIILTARASGAPAASTTTQQPAQQSFQTHGQMPAEPDQEVPDSEIPDDASQPEQPPPVGEGEQNEQLNQQPPAPGSAPPNGEAEQGNPNQPKTPEQLLQELQRMQQQQQQQQQNQTPE